MKKKEKTTASASTSTQPEPNPAHNPQRGGKKWLWVALACVVAAGLFWLFAERKDVVFTIAFEGFNSRSGPVIKITPNGKPRPPGSGPFGDYILVMRPANSMPYTRQFDTTQAETGVNLDFLVTKEDLKSKGHATVAVENFIGGSVSNTIRLSNRIEIPLD